MAKTAKRTGKRKHPVRKKIETEDPDIRQWYIGIDPGQTGAFALVRGDRVNVWDMPVIKVGKKTEVVAARLSEILNATMAQGWALGIDIKVGLEKVAAMPGQGVTSMFNFGDNYGQIKGVLGASQIPYELVRPQEWRKAILKGGAKDKDATRLWCIRTFPAESDEFKRKKDQGRADATAIACWLRIIHG